MTNEGLVPVCVKCGGIIKPDITFFGEGLPSKFYKHINEDFRKCDLLIIIGTSLTVEPFASLCQKSENKNILY
jgi:NAD-dependent deacetylase sirtuin 2